MSLQAFAAEVGVKWQSAQQWEKEDHEGGTAPTRSRQQRVADVLGISLHELVTGTASAATSKGDRHVRASTIRPLVSELRSVLARMEKLIGQDDEITDDERLLRNNQINNPPMFSRKRRA